MATPHIVVLAIDGLRASALGAYGNTWFPTPQLDQLAAESFVADWCFAGEVDLAAIYRSLWFGFHAMREPSWCTPRASLARRITEAGYETVLMSDDPHVLQLPGATDFHHTQPVESSNPTHPADDPGETQIAHLMEAAGGHLCDRLCRPAAECPQFIWIHSQGMHGTWDAPLEWRAALADEGDPRPYAGTQSPSITVNREEQPDELFPYACSYAAQVQLLDACLGALLDLLHDEYASRAADKQRPFMLWLQGVRGLPLGEHDQIGGIDKRLFVEQLHVPLLIRTADTAGCLARSNNIIEQNDLAATVLNVAGASQSSANATDGRSLRPLICGERSAWRDHSLAVASTGRRVIHTPSWSMHLEVEEAASDSAEMAGSACKLFARPDDRFEVNDVAQLRPDVVAGLKAACEAFEAGCQQAPPLDPPALAAALVEPIE